MLDESYLKSLDDFALIQVYKLWINELKDRNIIRTKNIIGDIGEYIAIKYYSENAGLPKLMAAPIGTQSIDAISRDGKRYTIKSITGKNTGVFYGLNSPDSLITNNQIFEYVIIVIFNDNLTIKNILELDWSMFIKHKKWHSRMQAWYLSVSMSLLKDCKIVYSA